MGYSPCLQMCCTHLITVIVTLLGAEVGNRVDIYVVKWCAAESFHLSSGPNKGRGFGNMYVYYRHASVLNWNIQDFYEKLISCVKSRWQIDSC